MHFGTNHFSIILIDFCLKKTSVYEVLGSCKIWHKQLFFGVFSIRFLQHGNKLTALTTLTFFILWYNDV